MFRQLADDLILSIHCRMATLFTHAVSLGPFVCSSLLLGPPLGFPGGTVRGHRGEVRQFAGSVPVGAADAVLDVKLDRQLQRLVTLDVGRSRVLAPDFHQPHREPEHAPDDVVASYQLDAGVTTVLAGQVDGVGVAAPHLDGAVVLVLTHTASPSQR